MAWPTSFAHLAVAAAADSPHAAAIRDVASVACGDGSARFTVALTADTIAVWHVLGSDAGGTLEVGSYRRSEHDVRAEGAAEQCAAVGGAATGSGSDSFFVAVHVRLSCSQVCALPATHPSFANL
jgi:hypothetical protein